MQFAILEFIKDRNSMSFDEFSEKYKGKIPTDISIVESIKELKQSDSLSLLIDEAWYGDHRDRHVHYLISSDQNYEVFVSERNGKHCLEKFQDLEQAAFLKIDSLLNEMNCAARDSKINS